MVDNTNALFDDTDSDNGPVECLGLTFKDNATRREHFLKLLRDKLKDPAFRQLEGFPIGEDEDILALSDPPYFTVCPNPWGSKLVDDWKRSRPDHEKDKAYQCEPFAADVSEGKYDPIYKYHPYPTKVPHRAIMRYILHYTLPGDSVLDGFSGTGMTGVAAQLCGDRKSVESLGYKVDKQGDVFAKVDSQKKDSEWKKISALGARRAVLNDLSPAAAFISFNYNTPVDVTSFERRIKRELKQVEDECRWMYETRHSDGAFGLINYTTWSDVFACSECGEEIVFWNEAVNIDTGKIKDDFPCPHCNARMTKRNLERKWETKFDKALNEPIRQAVQAPVLINYSVGTHRHQKPVDAFDLQLLQKIEDSEINEWFPVDHLPEGYNTRQPINSHGIAHVHQFYTRRNLIALAKLRSRCSDPSDLLMITKVAFQITKLYRFTYQSGVWGAGGGPLSGTLYIPSLVKELNIVKQLKNALRSRRKVAHSFPVGMYMGSCGSSTTLSEMPANSIDYIFLDPPFGSNLNYSELAILWESWLKVRTNNKQEAIENEVQEKGPNEYRELMTKCFGEAYRVLKPGRWMTVEFSNTKASVWNNIQSALTEAGFIVANVSALDKKKKTFKAVTTPTAVKQDLVISAYKPNGGFAERFEASKATEDAVWDFVRTHLKYLPVTKVQDGEMVPVPERDPRLLFDQLVGYYVRHGYRVPISSPEFQLGLRERFAERDGAYFLADQVPEYDRKRLQSSGVKQLTLFVSDESSAILWLKDILRKKPQKYQDIHPQFIREIGGWKKSEKALELSTILEQNCLCFDGKGDVPSQIHSYLSSNFKELRNLPKDDSELVRNAMERWYVPDPNKEADLEKKRQRELLKEFETYRSSKSKLQVFRIEALRVGFQECWQKEDYSTILEIASRVKDELIQDDPALLMYSDNAAMRTGG